MQTNYAGKKRVREGFVRVVFVRVCREASVSSFDVSDSVMYLSISPVTDQSLIQSGGGYCSIWVVASVANSRQ